MSAPLTLHVHPDLSAIDAADWDRMLPARGAPFVSHAFLRALEETGCVEPEQGWQGAHLTVRREGRLLAAAPAWMKGNSMGEFVYDWAWADLAHRMNQAYYPKLILASPFSPVGGGRLLVDPGLGAEEAAQARRALLEGARTFCTQEGLASAGLLFPTREESRIAESAGWLRRTQFQFHWHNEGFGDFEGWLATLRSKRKRAIRRERKRLCEQGYRVHVIEGADADRALVERVHRWYGATCDRFSWGRRYLHRAFFDRLFATCPEALLVLEARDADGAPVAGAFCMQDEERLYGRYWGCDVDVPLLHFEVTTYALIEHAIRSGRRAVEFGHGGEHKFHRGLIPVRTESAHWIAEPTLRAILARHLEGERALVEAEIEARNAASARHDP